MNPRRRLRLSAGIALAAHLAAGLSMAAILRYGLQTNLDLASRLAFLVEHRALWTVGWLSWTLAGLSILYFYACYSAAHQDARNAGWLRAAVFITYFAIAFDWSAQWIEIVQLPGLARQGDLAAFLDRHRLAVLLTGGLANILYTIAAALLLWPTRARYAPAIVAAGAGVVIFGTAMTLASVADSTRWLFVTNAGLIPCLSVWLIGVALDAGDGAD